LNTFLIFPHQLFETIPAKTNQIILVEENLFFSQYPFHKQKIVWQRASMRAYFDKISKSRSNCHYISAQDKLSDIRLLLADLAEKGVEQIHFFECSDNWLNRRLHAIAKKHSIERRL
jgi:deoxyribodipyrimidine photolyase-related protein